MASPSGRKAAKSNRRRTLPTSPLQKALEPGSQDDLRPESPSFHLHDDDDGRRSAPHDDDEINSLLSSSSSSSSSSRASAENCLGPGAEDPAFAHGDPAAVAAHLEAFLHHQSAWSLLNQCGLQAVNDALSELPYPNSVHSPPGFFTVRARAIANGGKPIRKTRSHDDEGSKYLEEYQRRRGTSPRDELS